MIGKNNTIELLHFLRMLIFAICFLCICYMNIGKEMKLKIGSIISALIFSIYGCLKKCEISFLFLELHQEALSHRLYIKRMNEMSCLSLYLIL